jgi:hypothetical protein
VIAQETLLVVRIAAFTVLALAWDAYLVHDEVASFALSADSQEAGVVVRFTGEAVVATWSVHQHTHCGFGR